MDRGVVGVLIVAQSVGLLYEAQALTNNGGLLVKPVNFLVLNVVWLGVFAVAGRGMLVGALLLPNAKSLFRRWVARPHGSSKDVVDLAE